MLAFLTTAAKVALHLAPTIVSLFSRQPDKANPTVSEIQDRHNTERGLKDALDAAKAAKDLSDQLRQNAEQERQRSLKFQEDADKKAKDAADEIEKMKGQLAGATSAAKHAESLAEAASKANREDAAKYAHEAREERERAQKIREDAERTMAAARQEAEKAQRVADEQRRAAEEGRARAEEMARKAAEETRKANEAKADAERRLKEGIQPVVTPTPEELAAAKRRIQYREDRFHFAVAGISGSGKSSLVNAFRGLRNNSSGAAAVGVTETTLRTTRYEDANPDNPYVWCDVPGAGTLKCRDWQYFNDQGLYVFDCIIVLFDNRFTMTDIAILTNARRFKIPVYIVRSKADQHIRNIMMDMGYDEEGDDEEDVQRRNRLYNAARREFIDSTRRNVQANLEDANLSNQRVYIVSNGTLLSIVQNKTPRKMIDEVDLLNDLYNDAYRRRRTNPVPE